MIEKSDEELMLAFAQLDNQAFEHLYARHKDALYRYFLRHVSNPTNSQELYQDLWMKVIQSKHNYQATAKFTTWLYTLAHNRLVDWYRKNKLEMQSFTNNTEITNTEGSTEWNPADELQAKRLGKQLQLAIKNLPFDQREVFLLHQEAMLSLPQIAQMLQQGLEKIKSRYRYALKKLRNDLENIR